MELLDATHGYQTALSGAQRVIDRREIVEIDSLLPFMKNKAQSRPDIDAFHVIEIDFFPKRLQFWQAHLGGVEPFYALKTNHDAVIVSVLAALGLGFDCASIKEVEQLVALGVHPDRIIFANPHKSIHTIERLKSYGVKRVVFDCWEELEKLISHYPAADLVLRIATDDAHSVTPLSSKFGADLKEAHALIDHAAAKGGNLVGVSFHVGSNCDHPPSYRQAISDAARVISYGKQRWNLDIGLLDLGGGWPGANDNAFESIAQTVNASLREFFPDGIKVIAEPGSFFASQSTTAAVRIINQRERGNAGIRHNELYLACGIYGLFFCGYYLRYDPNTIARYGWRFLPLSEPLDNACYPTTLWGPTCDSIDKIVENYSLPIMASGSWLYTHNIGSYAYAIQTNFNQITPSEPTYVIGAHPPKI